MSAELNTSEETEQYLQLLQDSYWRERRDALDKLMYSVPDYADQIFTAALPLLKNDESTGVRWKAAHLIAKIGDKRAIASLLDALDQESDIGVKGDIISALGTTKDKALFDKFLSILEDRTQPESIRSSAASALGNLCDVRALEPLGKSLKDVDRLVRTSSVLGLRKIDDRRVVDLLIEALEDEDSHVRGLAISFLGDFKDKRAITPLEWVRDHDKDIDRSMYGNLSEWAGYTAAKLRGEGLTNLDEFITTFREGDIYTRRRIVDLLGARANPDAVDFLITALRDPEPEVRDRVIEALADIRDEKAIPALEWVMQNDNGEVGGGHKLKKIAEDRIAFIGRKQEDEA